MMHFAIISYLLSLLSRTNTDEYDAIWWIWRHVEEFVKILKSRLVVVVRYGWDEFKYESLIRE